MYHFEFAILMQSMRFLIFRKSASIAKITQPFKVKTDLMTVLYYMDTD